jgi:ABC-2 type transport system ATP-binding protein
MVQPQAAIDVRDLSKAFHVPRQHVHTFKERALHPFRRTQYDELRALRDVSFEIGSGEFFGIVGRNGSGKSTLLKCMAGIYRADEGSIRVAGRLAPFIELGVGFNPDLPALDNVIINAVMMGLTPREARERFDAVIEFAELEDFLDLKLKNYSSGMQVRLAFSVMVQVGADVLLIDEVLAVGDAAFQQKCFDVFYRLRNEGKTIVLVTHAVGLVERFGHRALLLEGGRIEAMGDPAEVGRRYLELNFEHNEERAMALPTEAGGASVVDTWLGDGTGGRLDILPSGERFELNAVIRAHERIHDPEVHVWLENSLGVRVFTASTRDEGAFADALEPGERVHVRVLGDAALAAGRYFVGCSLIQGERSTHVIFYAPHGADFLVPGDDWSGSVLDLDHELHVELLPASGEVGAPERSPR